MTKVAVLGRGSPLTALPLLSGLISHRQQQISQAITSGHTHSGLPLHDTHPLHDTRPTQYAWQHVTLSQCMTLLSLCTQCMTLTQCFKLTHDNHSVVLGPCFARLIQDLHLFERSRLNSLSSCGVRIVYVFAPADVGGLFQGIFLFCACKRRHVGCREGGW